MTDERARTATAALSGWRSHLSRMGPAWIAGAIAAGPATMASLVEGGATFGYSLLWVVVLSAVLGALAQYLAMRLGLLTEAGIVDVTERFLGSGWAWLLVATAVLASGLAQLIIMKTLADVSALLTGTEPWMWAAVWALVLAIGLAGGGYKIAELGAKVLVGAVVVVFVASLFVVPIDYGAAAGGLAPTIPGGVGGALLAAGILGGAVHITLVTMHSYTMRSRGWTDRDYGLATFDIGGSMLVAFGLYSLAIFLVAASVLSPEQAGDALQAAQALGPAVGEYAQMLFLLGLWGAAVTTLGANTVVPPYLIADKLGWDRDVSDPRFRAAVIAVALVSALGVVIEGAFLPLLVLTLAIGLVGTPLALTIVLYLLNDPAVVPETNSTVANVAGLVLIGVVSFFAGGFVLDNAAGSVTTAGIVNPLGAAVGALAVIQAIAIVILAVKFLTNRTGAPAAEPAD